MTREEIQVKLQTELINMDENHQPMNVTQDKIMLLIDTYIESRDNKEEPNIDEHYQAIVDDSPTMVQALIRNGFDLEKLYDECKQFLEINYPCIETFEQFNNARKHFFNYMKKRKPEQSKTQW